MAWSKKSVLDRLEKKGLNIGSAPSWKQTGDKIALFAVALSRGL